MPRTRSVVTASELEAGYAADGYARTKGLGAASVAYGVGSLSMINAIAGAYVERSPVAVINGGPTSQNLSNLHQFDVVFSHSIGQDATDLTTTNHSECGAGWQGQRGTGCRRSGDFDGRHEEAPSLHRDQHGHLEFSLSDAGWDLAGH